MELLLRRISTGDESTIGNLFAMNCVGGATYQNDVDVPAFRCFTMEDQPNEPKVPGETRIPAGLYKIELRTEGGMHARYMKRFSWHLGMLWLQDVPEFEWVYIHVGNYERDTDGCILVGDGVQSNVIEDGMVMSSVAAYKRLYTEIVDALDTVDEGVWLTVEDYA